MRLALVSDIHANLEALEATFYDIAERSIDRIVSPVSAGYEDDRHSVVGAQPNRTRAAA